MITDPENCHYGCTPHGHRTIALKTEPQHFAELLAGRKTSEIRFNDRHYSTDDSLTLQEWNPKTNEYTGRWIGYRITHILDHEQTWGLQPGYVILSLAATGRSSIVRST